MPFLVLPLFGRPELCVRGAKPQFAFLLARTRFGTADVLTVFIGLSGEPFSPPNRLIARHLHTSALPTSGQLQTSYARA
jgi:hypothetical protein